MINALYAWILFGGFIGGFIQMFLAHASNSDDLNFPDAFWFAMNFYECYEEDLNRAGLIIGVVFISLLVLPGSILIILITAFKKLLEKMWALFKYTFRRRK